jgi:hypothetical protein
MNKKTEYPDLEKLPKTNFWKHLLNWAWNKPLWLSEELYEKYFLTSKKELHKKELELSILEYKIKELELQIEINKIQNTEKIIKFPLQ